MSLKKEALSGVVWTYGQQFGTQFLSFGVSIVLARMLLPEEFGLIGMIAIFMGIGTTLFDGGMTSSLIRSENLEEKDYSTVFLFNFFTSLGIYALIFVSAPLIADFYHQPILKDITRVYALSFIFAAFGTVQNTRLTKALNFKKQALLALPALILSSIVGLAMAYMGYGVWSLVGSTLVNSFLLSLFLWWSSDWRPEWTFDKESFYKHFGYGYKLTLSGILDTVFTNLYQIVIGRYYSASLVGFYTRANQLMMMPVGNISTALNKVAFPLFAKVQDEPERLKSAYKRIMLMVLFIVTPMIGIMLILAEPLVVFLFTEKWIKIVPIFQILCLSGLLYPLHLYNLLILQVKGRSDLFLKLEIIKKVLASIVLIISFSFGFYALLWGQLFFSVLALLINTHYAGAMLDYKMKHQIIDIMPILFFGVIMVCGIYFVDQFLIEMNNFMRLCIGSSIGGLIYLGMAYILKFESLLEIKNIIQKK